MQTQILGKAESIKPHGNVLIIKMPEAEARVWVYSPTIIRVCISRHFKNEGSFAVIQEPAEKLDYIESEKEIVIETSAMQLRIAKSPLRFNFYTAVGKVLSEDDPRFGVNWQGERVVNYRKLVEDEKFIGLGEKTGNLNRRGSSYVNWNTDAALH
ncbi:MAG: DUF4968 domain-containing protein, partial [Bacteroidota bacterium]|nr:DUF4968 domain-containing protein [Bacteroidota bacterium]